MLPVKRFRRLLRYGLKAVAHLFLLSAAMLPVSVLASIAGCIASDLGCVVYERNPAPLLPDLPVGVRGVVGIAIVGAVVLAALLWLGYVYPTITASLWSEEEIHRYRRAPIGRALRRQARSSTAQLVQKSAAVCSGCGAPVNPVTGEGLDRDPERVWELKCKGCGARFAPEA